MKEAWVFGATKALGKAVIGKLAVNSNIIAFSRRRVEDMLNTEQVIIDFINRKEVDSVIAGQLERNIPDVVVFCQRYRPESKDELTSIIEGCIIESGPVISLVMQLRKQKITKPVSIVLITSIAGKRTHVDVPLYYHILKSNTLCLNEYFSVHERNSHIRINCICLGEFVKYNINEYKEIEITKFELLKKYLYKNKMPDLDDVTGIIAFLASPVSGAITGQVFFMDGNLNNIAQESLIRSIVSAADE